MKQLVIAIYILLGLTYPAFGQNSLPEQNATPANSDTINLYSARADSLLKVYIDSLSRIRIITNFTHADHQLDNPYYYRLFVSPMLYSSPLKKAMSIDAPKYKDNKIKAYNDLNDLFCTMYVKYPYLVKDTELRLDSQTLVRDDMDTKISHKVQVSEIVKPKVMETLIDPVEAVSRKPNFWTFSNGISLNLQQYYFSDNWYQGGDNYNSVLATYRLHANYNNKQKITFNNTLEIDLGFQTDKNDTEHTFKTNTDRIRLTNNLGIQASGLWYYSAMLQSWTQLFPKYHNNSNTVYSDFMSPFESVLSLGMKYDRNKNGNRLSIHMAPLAYNFKYVDREALFSRYGIRGSHHTYETFGSNVNITWTWKLLKELTWTGRLYYFTNYEKVQVEWENTFQFAINKYLNTKLYLYPRFDDSYKSDKSHAVLQFKEWLALGFNLNF